MAGVTAIDRSGQGNNGTLTNGPTKTIGKIGQALSFDGVNDHVPIDDTGSSALEISGPVSICVWFRARSLTGDTALVSDTSASGSGTNYNFETRGDDLLFQWDDDFPSLEESYETTANILSTGIWYQACAIRISNASAEIYLNGARQSVTWNGTDKVPPGDTDGVPTIGQLGSGNVDYFNGLIDDVRIYNRALSSAEIKRLYLMGR